MEKEDDGNSSNHHSESMLTRRETLTLFVKIGTAWRGVGYEAIVDWIWFVKWCKFNSMCITHSCYSVIYARIYNLMLFKE